ncbi:MAG TPA: hypothetical protein VFX18_04915 [Candidatus Nitrosocosmicus sp.]|nr:hypothetical protein [Candidatus Nitrosocosmicus sp.]
MGYNYKQFYNDYDTISYGKVFREFLKDEYKSIFIVDDFRKIGLLTYPQHQVIYDIFGNDFVKFSKDDENIVVDEKDIYSNHLVKEIWRKLKLEELNMKKNKNYKIRTRSSGYYDYDYLYDPDSQSTISIDNGFDGLVIGIQNLIEDKPFELKKDSEDITKIDLKILEKIVMYWF